MLNKLFKVGEDKYLFKIYPLKDLDKSCCEEAKCEVIDFDEAKLNITKQHNLQSISSCDGFKISNTENSLSFIELKSINKIIKYHSQKKAKNIINSFDFEKKIEDSLYLLQTIINNGDFTNEDKRLYKQTDKKYFIVIDKKIENNGIENLCITMEYLSSIPNQDIMRVLIDKVNKISINIDRPILLSCDDICTYIKD